MCVSAGLLEPTPTRAHLRARLTRGAFARRRVHAPQRRRLELGRQRRRRSVSLNGRLVGHAKARAELRRGRRGGREEPIVARRAIADQRNDIPVPKVLTVDNALGHCSLKRSLQSFSDQLNQLKIFVLACVFRL